MPQVRRAGETGNRHHAQLGWQFLVFLRYCDPHNDQEFASMEKLKYWLGSQGVDWYNGGMEHVVYICSTPVFGTFSCTI